MEIQEKKKYKQSTSSSSNSKSTSNKKTTNKNSMDTTELINHLLYSIAGFFGDLTSFDSNLSIAMMIIMAFVALTIIKRHFGGNTVKQKKKKNVKSNENSGNDENNDKDKCE